MGRGRLSLWAAVPALLLIFLSGGAARAEAGAPEGAVSEAGDEYLAEELFDFEGEEELIADPLEPLNRGFFWFNDRLYFYLLKPAARVWRGLVPEKGRVALSRTVSNAYAPLRMVNCLLQGRVDDAGNELGRFMINTTVGVGGLFDPAKKMTGVAVKQEDFGQTLGRWGIGSGFYIVWPLLGPSSLRDTVGVTGDFYLNPLYPLIPSDDRVKVHLSIKAGNFINATSLDRDTYEGIKEQQLDPYSFIRNAYAQKEQGDVEK